MPEATTDPPRSPPLRPSRARRLYFLLILACAAVVAIDPMADYLLPAAAPRDPALAPTPEIELLARFAIATKSLAPSVSLDQLFGQLDDARVDPAMIADRDERISELAAHLRTAIAEGEITDSTWATARIDSVRPIIEALDPPDPELATDAETLTRIYAGGQTTLTAGERDRLTDRHGLMGRIALAFDLPDQHPDRAPIVRACIRALAAIVTIVTVGSIGMVIGFVLLTIAIVLRTTGRLKPRFVPDRTSPPDHHNAFLESVVVFISALAAFKALSIGMGFVDPDPSVPVRIALYAGYWVIALAAFWPRLRGVGHRTLARSLGWTRGRGVLREMCAGLIAYVAFLPVLAVGFLLLVLLSQLLGVRPSHPLVEDLPSASPWELVMLYSLAAVWAPLVEETMFRGALYHHLRRFTGAVVSALFTAFLFAAIHPQGITTIPALMALAMGFAACREWRGSLIGPITAHALHNAVLITLNLALFG